MSARAALEFAKGRLKLGQQIKIESILGSIFSVELKAHRMLADTHAVIPRVSGEAFVTGKHTFLIDPNDPLKQGFIFR